MKLQILQDSKGHAPGVYIPIADWRVLKKQFHQLAILENEEKNEESSKEQILMELKESFRELKLIEQGKLKSRPAKELLDDL